MIGRLVQTTGRLAPQLVRLTRHLFRLRHIRRTWVARFATVTDESTGAMPMPSAGTLLNLAATGSVGFSGTVVVTMFLNGSAAALTCTISTAVNPNNQCTDTIHRVAVHRGDLVGVQLTGPNIDIPNFRVTAEKR